MHKSPQHLQLLYRGVRDVQIISEQFEQFYEQQAARTTNWDFDINAVEKLDLNIFFFILYF